MKKSVIIALSIFAVLLLAAGIAYYCSFHPAKIHEGENRYSIGSYSLTQKGLRGMAEMIAKSDDKTSSCNVAYFEATLNKSTKVSAFTLSLEVFDESGEYLGLASYVYRGHTLTYTAPQADALPLVRTPDANREISYLSSELTTLPLKKQIAVSGLSRYVLSYQPETLIESGTPIFDCRAGSCPVLSPEDYNNGQGGVSDGNTSVVFRLYDGTSIAVGQQYLYVCQPVNADTAVGVQDSYMPCDYYINAQGLLQFTRDYGRSWITCNITAEELSETMEYYRNYLSLPVGSWFLSPDESFPIAVFYGGNPILKISADGGQTWFDTPFPTAEEFGRDLSHRVVGFYSATGGWAAVGTDWSMGAGEGKRLYLTEDGGKTWVAKTLPLQNSSRTLQDAAMADPKNGILDLSAGMDEPFPLLYATTDGGDNWEEITLPYADLPEEAQYLTDISSFTLVDGQYVLTLGQGEDGTLRATFTAPSPKSPWSFTGTERQTIHTVG